MGQVHGPYDTADWKTMGFLKKKTEHFQAHNEGNVYGTKIARNTTMLRDYMLKGIEEAA